jgi:high-affinity iron transporter
MPSLEEVIAYIGYFVVIYLLINVRNSKETPEQKTENVKVLEPKTKKII